MIVWLLGDAGAAQDAESLATALGATFVDSSTPDASVESVWVEQLYEPRMRQALRRSADDIVVVVWINNADYDVEATIGRIRQIAPTGTVVLYLVPDGSSMNTLDGFTHYDDGTIRWAVFGNTTLMELYESDI